MKPNWYYSIFTIITVIFLSCNKEEDNNIAPISLPAPDSLVVSNLDLKGYVQKGPFINGTAITVSELDSQLVATGKNFNAQIIDNKGTFVVKGINLKSEYVQLMANGFYFDEVQGEKSVAQLTMYALVNVLDISSVNVNLLSHLEKDRVIYLIQEEGKTFVEAKHQAEQEILTMFGIAKEDMTSAELLDISQEGEDNAILLAISAILQANNTVAELTELLANTITDIREDGKLDSESSQAKLREQAMQLHLADIRSHLVKRYEELGVKASIPNFEKYVDSDGDGILNKDEDDTPDEFTFVSQKDVAIHTAIFSNEITINGLKPGGASDIQATHARLFINGNAANDSLNQVKNGDKLKLQLISSSQYADTAAASVSIGYLTSYFTVVTDDYQAESFSFSAQKDVAVDSSYTSNTITISGLPYATPTSIDNGLLIKNGIELSTDTTSVKNGDQLAIKLKSSQQYFTSTSSRLDINGAATAFELTTDDYSPNAFSFKNITKAKRNTLYFSDTITITGLPHPTPIGLARFGHNAPVLGKIYINDIPYTSHDDFSIVNGDKIYIEVGSEYDFEVTATASLTINNKEAQFLVTTENNPWQRKSVYPGGAVALLAGFSIGNKIYFSTGYISPNVVVTRECYEYDTYNNEWAKRSDFGGLARASAVGFSINSIGYIGIGEEEFEEWHLFNDVWKYDMSSDKWTEISPLPSGKGLGFGFSINDKGYIGITYDDEIPDYELWELNSNGQWSKKNNHPFSSSIKFLFAINSKAYFQENDEKTSLWIYNQLSDSWTKTENPYEIGLGFTLNGTVYATGKEGWYKYNPNNDSWTKVEGTTDINPDMCFSINGKGYCIGYTYKNDNFDYELWEFTPPQE